MVDWAKEQCGCFTGHRFLPKNDLPWLRRRVGLEVVRLWRQGVQVFLAGGALGFDTLAAQETLRLQQGLLPGIRLVLVLPCLEQEKNWPIRDQLAYREILRQASDVIYTSGPYTKGCMFQRDRYMVENSAHCICYLRPGQVRGGTLYTVNFARRSGLQVSNLFGRCPAMQPALPPSAMAALDRPTVSTT